METKINACFNQLVDETSFYLNFFKKRAEIEEKYAESMAKLINSSDEQESLTHRGIAASTLRTAYLEMRDDAIRVMDVHRSTAAKIRVQVIDPLTSFRDSKDRVRKRCKEELKTASTEHTDYKAAVTRFQKSYERSCEQLRQQHADSLPPIPTSDPGSPPSGGAAPASTPANSGMTSPRQSAPDIISAVSMASIRDIQPPTASSGPAARATDALKQSKHQFATLINRLGGDQLPSGSRQVSGGQSTSASDIANGNAATVATQNLAKMVKARKDAEMADLDYRKGVIHLETLRLQKERVFRSATGSVLEFCAELGHNMKDAFAQFCDIMRWSSGSTMALWEHSAAQVTLHIVPEADAGAYTAKLPIDSALEPVVYYENAFVGRCKSLVFGVPLDFYAASYTPPRMVPRIVQLCTHHIEEHLSRYPATEGIYRVSPVQRKIPPLVLEIEKDENVFQFGPDADVHTVSSILKLYLRQLPLPLWALSLKDRISMSKLLADPRQASATRMTIAKKLRRLSVPHQATLKEVVAHIRNVARFEATTKMHLNNLSIILSPCLFDGETDWPVQGEKDLVLETLVNHFDELFEGIPTDGSIRNRSSSLPNTPLYIPRTDEYEEFPIRKSAEVARAAAVDPLSVKRRFSVKRVPPTHSLSASVTLTPSPVPQTPQPTQPLQPPVVIQSPPETRERTSSRSRTPSPSVPTPDDTMGIYQAFTANQARTSSRQLPEGARLDGQ